jgi:hypothetical protein
MILRSNAFRPARIRALAPLAYLALAAASHAATPASPRTFDPATSDPSAMMLADSILAGLGGQAAWDGIGYLAFDFVVRRDTTTTRRSLRWDRSTNQVRVEGVDQKGRRYVIRTDLDTRDGTALLDGASADSATRAGLLERGYAIWVNDTYWLLMPYKLKDPGVRLKDAGSDSTGRQRVLHLSFDRVGLTPGDQYWIYYDPGSRSVTRWDMLLQGDKDGQKDPVLWTDWQSVGGIRLASRRVFPDGATEIRLENLVALAKAPAGAFDP